ncbi:hypothetical protein K493DRAFT_384907 [Basidiobolus meristosporus CBS 931.73]|uniref:GH18 domain-containing protein n=1 Tax=Basidiobolus meristosporus CBS 931.73 TaxID=1314790 RepID=A0A1Y1XS19_9FUNG|nr:hypothetical protein K493DRAFT_384907 [Basidiobolus meristosporus CBS 931.73]|eukprot:ORX88559.1 hypothetical protein K493DRAFT_384907 [Basidiobolus meristosporus CBS 931.73]
MKLKLFLISTISATLLLAPFAIEAADDKVVVGYYVPWGKVEPEQLSLDKVTHINYGFGVLTKKTSDPTAITIDRYYDGTRIRKLKQLASAKGVKTLMSLGGWTGSQTFSTIVRDAALRKKFINNALVFVRKNTKPDYDENPDGWDLDGIDIDWEYPGRNAAICNIVDKNDSANYLILLKELRAALDAEFPNEHKLLTAAVRVQPFDGVDGKPMADVSAYAQYFDFINVMAYDIMGSWSATTGPNAPFDYDTAKGGDAYSFRQSINDWLGAKWPANKLVMGVPFYGRSLTATVDMNANPGNMYAAKDSVTPKGDSYDANEPNSFCNEGTFYSGIWKWKSIRSDILQSGTTTPVSGWSRYWDNTTQTPWLFRASDKRFISYDDPQSLKIKVDHTRQSGLRGVMYWDMSHDSNDELLNVLQGVRCTGSGCPSPSVPPVPTSTVQPTTTITSKTSTVPSVTSSVSTTSGSPSPTSVPGICNGVADWNASTAYNGAQKAVYKAHLWQAKWWTQNDTPGNNSQNVWTDLGAC